MRIYELALVLKPSLSVIERKKIKSEIKNILKGLKLTEEKEIGEKQLNYKIKKETMGYYIDLEFEGETPVPSDFERKLLIDENVLRHLLIRRK